MAVDGGNDNDEADHTAGSTTTERTADPPARYNQQIPWVLTIVANGLAVSASTIGLTAAAVSDAEYAFGASRVLTGAGWTLLLLAAVVIVLARSWVLNENWLPKWLHHDSWRNMLAKFRKPASDRSKQRSTDSSVATTIAVVLAAVGTTLALDGQFSTLLWALLASVVMAAVGPSLGWITAPFARAKQARAAVAGFAMPAYLLLIGVWLAARAFVLEFDTALEAMTPSGREQRGYTSISSVFQPQAAPDRLQETWTSWTDYESSNLDAFVGGGVAHVPRPIEAVAWHTLIDSLATVVFALLLLGLIWWVDRRVGELKLGRSSQLKAMLSVARFAAPTVAVLDIAENTLGLGAVRLASVAETSNQLGTTARVLALVRGFATTGYAVSLAAIAAAVAIAAGHVLQSRAARSSTLGTALRTLRGHIALVAIFGLLLRNGQAYDAIRTWQVGQGTFALDWAPVGWTVAMAFIAFAAIRFLGDFVLQQTLHKSHDPERLGDETSRYQTRWGYGVAALSLALVLWVFLDARGLFVGALVYFALEVLSGPLRARYGDDPGFFGRLREALFGGAPRPVSDQRGAFIPSLIGRLNTFWRIVGPTAAFVVATLIAHVIGGRPLVRWVLIAAAITTAVWSLVSLMRGGEATDDAREHNSLSHLIARLLGSALFIVLGAQIVRSGAGPMIYRSGGGGLVTVGLMFIAIGAGLYFVGFCRFRYWELATAFAAIRVALAAIFGSYLLVWELATPDSLIRGAQRVGTIGLVLAFVAFVAVIVTVISYLTEQTGVLPALEVLGFKRIPFYLLLAVWVLIAGRMDSGGYHDIDRIAPDSADATALASQEDGNPENEPTASTGSSERVDATAQRVFNDWKQRCVDGAEADQVVPMVFVAASGGGIRAAYWSAGVMDDVSELVEQNDACNETVFAMSGASGGSVGLAAHAVTGLSPAAADLGTRSRLDDDYLAPAVGWFLFADSVRALFLWDVGGDRTMDRAGVLARSFELSWDTQVSEPPPALDRPGCDANHEINQHGSTAVGIRDAWCAGSPLLLLNGTEVHSGCRFLGSVLDNRSLDVDRPPSSVTCRRPPTTGATNEAASTGSLLSGPLGATIDAADYLCADEDLPLSVAAVLSARFPFVTPSGRIERCGGDASDRDVAFVVDGGYLDNSGASALIELWAEVSRYVDDVNADPSTPCVVPLFVQIDNGYDFANAATVSRPLEFLVPLIAASSSLGAGEAEAKQVAANIFGSPLIPGDMIARIDADPVRTRWIRVVPEAHPGIQAPLGWVLSDSSQRDLDEQLGIEGRDGGLAQLEDVLAADVSCEPFQIGEGEFGVVEAMDQSADALPADAMPTEPDTDG